MSSFFAKLCPKKKTTLKTNKHFILHEPVVLFEISSCLIESLRGEKNEYSLYRATKNSWIYTKFWMPSLVQLGQPYFPTWDSLLERKKNEGKKRENNVTASRELNNETKHYFSIIDIKGIFKIHLFQCFVKLYNIQIIFFLIPWAFNSLSFTCTLLLFHWLFFYVL